MALERALRLAGAPNARELGGLSTSDGGRLRAGAVFRSGALDRLTAADQSRVAELGLACRIDLRHSIELGLASGAVSAAGAAEPGRRVVTLPVFDRAHTVFTCVTELLLDRPVPTFQRLVDEGSAVAMTALYRWFVADPRPCARFAAALRELADPANHPLVFHCGAGKDRTGWLTVLLLAALGVEHATIREDYLRTNADTEAGRAALLDHLRGRYPEAYVAAVEPILEARPEYLDAAYDEVIRLHGSFARYLRDALGVDKAVRARLQRHLLV